MKRFAANFWFTLFLTIAFAVSALLLVLLPAVAMPRLQGDAIEESLREQILSDARSGEFSVTFSDVDTVKLDSMHLSEGGGFLSASGQLVCDAGQFPYAVLAKKAPLSDNYFYDTRYRMDVSFPTSASQQPYLVEGVSYFLGVYRLEIGADAITARAAPDLGQAMLCAAFLILAGRGVMELRRIRRSGRA